ncbi:TPA: YopX family protein [Streptococcus suis]
MIPKFRAWYKKNTLPMLCVSLISFDQKFIDAYIDKEFKAETEMSFDLDDVILMQSTGLFDVNGKEVFEGDVVKLRYTISSDYEFFKVTRFRGGSWRIDNRRRGCELWLRNEDCEIIGNIYENPELMEATND